jgi:hypothetical protein
MCRNNPKQNEKPCQNTPESRNRSSGNNQPQRIQRGLYHDIMPTVCRYHAGKDRSSQTGANTDRLISAGTDTALSDRSSRAKSCTVNPAATNTDRSRNRPTNRADRISPNRSRQTGAACHGQTVPDFFTLSGQGIVQPVQCPTICHARKVLSAAFLR